MRLTVLLLALGFFFCVSPINAQVNPEDSTGISGGKVQILPDSTGFDTSQSGTKVKIGKIGMETPDPDTNIYPLIIEKQKKGKRTGLTGQDRDFSEHDPDLAYKRSAMLPGWGQVYNGSVWKVPIVYAGFGVLGGLIGFYHFEFRRFKIAAECFHQEDNACDPGPEFDGYDSANLIYAREFNRRYRDLTIIISVLWYGLNVLDAFVEGHLKNFNVSGDLSMMIKPSVQFDPINQRMALGAGLSFHLRK